MFTNAGMIGSRSRPPGKASRLASRSRPGRAAATLDGTPFEARARWGSSITSRASSTGVCARCHLAQQNDAGDGNAHAAGCAACHFPFAERADLSRPRPHDPCRARTAPRTRCRACRRWRLAPAATSAADASRSPTRVCAMEQRPGPHSGRGPGPTHGADTRSFTHIAPDVHFLAGMECIDCHTSREVMGDGYAAPDMRGQLEIRCENCHGDGERWPSLPHPCSARTSCRCASRASTAGASAPGDAHGAHERRGAPTPTCSCRTTSRPWSCKRSGQAC